MVKPDYAKWMLDDPQVNFAISTRGRQPGLDHLGIQVENKEELRDVYARLHTAVGTVIEQGQTNCCFAKSEKSWIDDPAEISWETFLTTGESTLRGLARSPVLPEEAADRRVRFSAPGTSHQSRIARHGRYRRVTGPPCDIRKTAVREASRKIAVRRSLADLGVWQAPAS